jgi:(1->4)-alpha-D-glucan 1-alpha-D-glucosylmutase
MLATSTHDSKRSEDARARINVLAEIPSLWRLRVRDWRRFNRSHKSTVNNKPAPSLNDEYHLYQTLVGAWPLELMTHTTEKNDWNVFSQRVENYMLKAIREAKENTSWINRNAAYEEAVSSFVKKLLRPGVKNRFLNDFVSFHRRIARIGFWNSLSQTLLKLTSPGVPDIYQGNELWDFSLVDPDNRRPVDYGRRRHGFESIRGLSSEPDPDATHSLLDSPEDSRLKLYLIWKTLCLRKERSELFQQGEYLPLPVQGAQSDHVVAFARKLENTNLLVIVPRLVASLLNEREIPPIGRDIWGETQLVLPVCPASASYRNIFTGEVLTVARIGESGTIGIAEILAKFPVAVLVAE